MSARSQFDRILRTINLYGDRYDRLMALYDELCPSLPIKVIQDVGGKVIRTGRYDGTPETALKDGFGVIEDVIYITETTWDRMDNVFKRMLDL